MGKSLSVFVFEIMLKWMLYVKFFGLNTLDNI